MKLRYDCLVLDHDDTVVKSTSTVHYPCFKEYIEKYFPTQSYTLEDYFLYNFDPGVLAFFRDIVGMTDEQALHEQEFWNDYVQNHVPPVYEGMRELLWDYKARGGRICVVSYSFAHNIRRDYRVNELPEPDMVFGWEYPRELRKPSSYPIETIMQKLGFEKKQLLVVDDMKTGYDMALNAGTDFSAAGWETAIPKRIASFIRSNCENYFNSIAEFREYLL